MMDKKMVKLLSLLSEKYFYLSNECQIDASIARLLGDEKTAREHSIHCGCYECFSDDLEDLITQYGKEEKNKDE